VASGTLTDDQLRAALAAQHTTNLMTLLQLGDAEYDWRGWEPPPAWAREVSVDPVGCLVDALEQEKYAPRRSRVLEWLGEHAARLSLDWPELHGRIALPPLDMRAASLLALPRRLRQFKRASALPAQRAEALLVALLLAGAAEPHQTTAQPDEEEALDPGPALDAGPALDPGPALDGEVPPEALVEAERAVEAAVREEELPELELDLERAPARVAAASKATAASGPPPAEDAPAPDSGEAGREMRKKLVARGLRNLGSLGSQPQPEPGVEGALAEEPQSSAAPASAELSYEDQRFADEVRSRARMISRQNAYERLGVLPGATTQPIKTAYLQLAKRFHPDRAAGPLATLQGELQALFAALKEAYESISSAPARAQYDAAAKAAQPVPRKEEAALALKMGDVLLKKRDFEAALGKLRHAVELDPTGDSLAALAWALVSDPKASTHAKEEAATLVNRALRAPGPTARTYYVAGVLWRTKDPDSATDAFRKALELDPQHSDAALELRLMEQRRGKSGQKGSAGVLSGLLFGKRKS